MSESAGIIAPLRDRITQLEREYESMTRTARQEIQRLQSENATLRLAVTAFQESAKIAPSCLP